MSNPVLQLKGLSAHFQWEPPLSRRSSCSNSPQMSFPNFDSICATSFEASVRASLRTLASPPLVASHALWHSHTTVHSENCKIHWCWLDKKSKDGKITSIALWGHWWDPVWKSNLRLWGWTDAYWFKVLRLLHNTSALSD